MQQTTIQRTQDTATKQVIQGQARLEQLADKMRDSVFAVKDPRAQALFETSAEVLLGLRTAFTDYIQQEEAAWQSTDRPTDRPTDVTASSQEQGAAEQDVHHAIEDHLNFHEASFRRHFQLTYVDSHHDYAFYAPAYKYGYELAQENPSATWHSLVARARRHWQKVHTTEWDEVADAVHYGWREDREPETLRADN